MNHILRPLLDECVVVYLDDILIYSHDMKQHVEHLRRVFEILRRERFYIKLSKSEFALEKVQLLGHMVSAQGVRVDPKKIEAVRTWKTPENVKELQQFLGFANYYNCTHRGDSTNIPTTLISDRDPKFTSKFWKELMSPLGTKLAMSSAYHPQTDGQTERLNQIVEQLLRAACKDEISKWDLHLPVLEFAYNNATHAATGQTPFFLCYGRHPLTPQKSTTSATVQPAHDFITTMHQLRDRTHKRLLDIQQQQKRQADRHRNDHTITVTDQVLLDTRNLDISHLPSKLRPRFCGPFLVEAQLTPVTFRLCLPTTWKIHNTFYVQLLKPYRDPNTIFVGRQPPPPPPVVIQNEPEYEVESVLAHRRRRNGTVELLIRWKGYDPSEDSWVPESGMGNARRPLHDYLVKQGVTSTTQL
ncbi:hypothetical protein CLOP_g25071 [Closterium sp. NIES-67]|nr:hypothetical protein CLOP_g25071 [Closterium sp. NIES-67]